MKPPTRPGMPPNPQWNMEKIEALDAWNLFSGNKQNVVAVMDYGIDFSHEDFGATLTVQGNLWDRGRVFADFARRGYDEINGPWSVTRPQPDGATKPQAGEFQGNHAAGIIGAVTNNRIGVAGLNWQTQLYSSKIVDGGRRPTIPVIQRAIDHIIQMRTSERSEQLVRAVAFGYSSDQDFGNPMPQFRRLVQGPLSDEKGILVTVPAGDLGPNVRSYPSWYAPNALINAGNVDNDALLDAESRDNIIVVGATDENDRVWSGNSNLGRIDIYAPGVNIKSIGNAAMDYPVETGTRQAAAHVAGAISLIYEAARVNDRVIAWHEVKRAILEGADRVNGILRLNVVGALKAADLYERPPVEKLRISLAGGSVNEGDAGMAEAKFTVTIAKALASPLTVQCLVTDGSATIADKDYLPVGVNGLVDVTIPAGQKTATLVVRVAGDERIEANETIKASFFGLADSFEVAGGEAEVTVVNDDAPPRISLDGPVSIVEGTGGPRTARVPIRLSAASTVIVAASVRTLAGTATEGSDYRLPETSQRVMFAPGQTTQVVNLTILADSVVEQAETLTVELFGPSNATLAAVNSAVITIIDDDAPRIVARSSVRRAVAQVATTMTFEVTLSKPAREPVSVGYSAVDGSAVNGVDFTLAPGTLTFAPGERTKTIAVVVAARRGGSYPRTFTVRLSDVLGGSFADGAIVANVRGTIV